VERCEESAMFLLVCFVTASPLALPLKTGAEGKGGMGGGGTDEKPPLANCGCDSPSCGRESAPRGCESPFLGGGGTDEETAIFATAIRGTCAGGGMCGWTLAALSIFRSEFGSCCLAEGSGLGVEMRESREGASESCADAGEVSLPLMEGRTFADVLIGGAGGTICLFSHENPPLMAAFADSAGAASDER